jgi:hypothetical protein
MIYIQTIFDESSNIMQAWVILLGQQCWRLHQLESQCHTVWAYACAPGPVTGQRRIIMMNITPANSNTTCYSSNTEYCITREARLA